jgi:hypothetical protein
VIRSLHEQHARVMARLIQAVGSSNCGPPASARQSSAGAIECARRRRAFTALGFTALGFTALGFTALGFTALGYYAPTALDRDFRTPCSRNAASIHTRDSSMSSVGFRPNLPARPIQGIHARRRGTFSHLATWRHTTRGRSGHNEQRLCDAALTRGSGFDEIRINIHSAGRRHRVPINWRAHQSSMPFLRRVGQPRFVIPHTRCIV